jgi:hypothetical protein
MEVTIIYEYQVSTHDDCDKQFEEHKLRIDSSLSLNSRNIPNNDNQKQLKISVFDCI